MRATRAQPGTGPTRPHGAGERARLCRAARGAAPSTLTGLALSAAGAFALSR